MRIARKILSVVLLCGMLLSMLPAVSAAKAEEAPALTQGVETQVPTISQSEFKNGTWNIDGAFRQIRPTLSKGAYWNATKANSYNKVITGDSIASAYFATPRFTKADIPVGSVIVVEQGWQYRPEGWIQDTQQSSRADVVTEKFIQVTEEWWGSYTLRGFNISKTDGSDLSDLYQSDIYEAFRIYVPDEYVALGYERYYPKLEHCAYWNCVDNKIYTRNSASDAANYFATAKQTKAMLPVGSIVIMDEGWQYRPEAWVTNTNQSSRQDLSTRTYLEITEEWWSNYTYRAFNLNRMPATSLVNYTTEDIHCIFRFYVPKKTTHIEGLSDEKTNAETKLHQIPSMTPGTDGEFEKTMSYILQSREGKIVVIDGGYEKAHDDGKMLFSYLQRITGKAKPHVDAWLFTHPHPDHFAAFLSVAKLYKDQITVDAVYHRFITLEEAEKYHYNTTDPTAFGKYYDKLVTHTAMLKNAKGETTPLIEINSVHSGKCNATFDFDEIHIDILLTCEDVYWAIDNVTDKFSGTLEENGKSYTNKTFKQIASTNVNEACIVFRVTVPGKTILFPGDGSIITEYMLTKYHNENAEDSSKYFNLKSDIVQVAHHGVQSMGKAIYHIINPNEALWCTPYHTYASRPGDYHTTYYIRQWFRTALATTNYVTFDGVDVLKFPVLRSDGAVSIPEELRPYVFSASYYADRYADLKEAYGTDETKLYNHFVNYGIEEGRCASPFFDVRFYMNNNSQNFRETMKGNYEKAFKHFLSNYKSTTLMKLSPNFDPAVYQASHKDLTTQFALLQHYAANGYLTGEVATKAYLSTMGHTYHQGYTVTPYEAPTCTANGATMGAKCTACGEAFVSREVIPALGHSYESVDTVLSCEEGSYIPDTAFFVNFTGTSDRYSTHAVYSGVDYDSASNWSYLDARYQTPTVDTAVGTMKIGFEAEGYNHLWIQTGASYNEGFSLNYQPKSDHIIKIRLRFEGLQVMSGKSNSYLRFNYFVGPDRYEGMGDKTERLYTMTNGKITAAQLASGEYVTLSFPVSGLDSADHTTITSLRLQLGDLESIDSANPGTIVLDYMYIGPDTAKMVTYLCTTCGHTYTEDYVASLGHKEVDHEGVAPTCTAGGLSDWQDCARCGKILKQQEELPPLGHRYEEERVEPTCLESGYVSYTCGDCGDFLAPEELPALGHRYEASVISPTCTREGYTAYNCVGCEEGYIADSVPALGHNAITDVGTTPTCTVGGITEGSHCDRCGEVLVKQEALSPTGHSYETLGQTPDCARGARIPDTAFFANFTGASDRYSQNSLYSGVDYDSAGNWSYLDARYQTPVVDTAAGTLTTGFEAEGYSHLWIQTGASYNNGFNLQYKPESDHVVQVRIRFDGLKAMTGKTNGYLSVNYFVGPDRYEGMEDKVERLYTLDRGKITSEQLSCGDFVVLTFPVSGLDSDTHTTITALRFQIGDLESTDTAKPGSVVVDYLYLGPEDGTPVTYLCTSCGDHYTVDDLAPGVHEYTSEVTEATCTQQGYTTHTCSVCGHSYTDSYVAAKGHEAVTDRAVEATCTATGLTEGKHCSLCNAVLLTQETVPAKGHTVVIDEAVDATCTETGLTEGAHCSLCSAVLTKQEILPAAGHSYTYTKTDGQTHLVGCRNCALAETAPHSYTEGACICGEPESKEPILETKWKMGHTLNLASDISVNFAVSRSWLADFDMDTVYLLTELDIYEGNVKTGTKTVKLLPKEQGDYYYFTLTGLTAVNMNDRIRSVLYGTKDGQPYYSATDDYSISDYAYSQMKKSNMPETLKILCADLLRYGTKAQIYKSYRTDNLADAAMTDAHKAYLSDMDGVNFQNNNTVLNDLEDATVIWMGKSLDLASKVTMKFIFNPADYGGDATKLSLHLTYMGIDGETENAVVAGAELYNTAYGFYAFSFDGLLAAELRTVISAQIYEGDTPVSCTLQYSADTYGNNKTGTLGELCKALFAYSDSAKRYFTN